MADHSLYNGTGESLVYTTTGLKVDAGERVEGNPNGVVLSRLIASGQLTDLGPVEAREIVAPNEDATPPGDAPALTEGN